MKSVHISELQEKIKNGVVVKKKRERIVLSCGDVYIKLWVPNWTQGDITKAAHDLGYYDDANASSLICLIYDETGQRGYVTKSGKPAGNDWNTFKKLTTEVERKRFIKSILEKSLKAQGIYTDLYPTNFIIIDDKVSLIDLDSFTSFSLLFQKKKEAYEKFDLAAWWKPYETAIEDLDRRFKEYFEQSLDIMIDFKINSRESIQKLIDKL